MRRSVRALVAGIATVALCGATATMSSVAYADAAAPAITTDQADYAPGSLVDLTGSDWPAGDAVHVTVDDSDGQTWRYSGDAVADGSGAFELQFNLPDWFVANYTAVAKDADGVTATRTFTDGNVQGRVFAGTTQVAETLAVTKYFGNGGCSGRLKTNQVTTSATGNTNLAGVGGSTTNPQSIGVVPPHQIVVSNHLYTFDHWTVTIGRGSPADQTANPCLTDTSTVAAHYTDSGVTTQQQQTITFDPIADKTYGASDFLISPTSDSGLTVSLAVSATSTCTLSSATSPATVHITGAGTCAITASQAGNSQYLAADPVEQDFLISPSSTGVTVNVTCPSTGQVFTGSAITPCTAEAVVDGASHDVTSSLQYANNVHVGTATATASYSDANHSLTTGQSTFQVVPQTVSVTVTGSQVYGGQPSFSGAYTLPSGVGITGDVTCAKIANGTNISPTLTAGFYALLSSSCSGLSLDNSDYIIGYVGSTFTVNQAVITATVNGGHIYGGTPSFSQTNDASGVTVSGTLSCSSTTAPVHTIDSALAATTYTIDGTTCGGLSPSDTTNYRIVYSGGSYVVTRAQILVTVTGGQTYGGTSKSFTGTPPSPMPTDVTYVQGSLSCTKLSGDVTIANTLGVTGPYTIDPTTCSDDSLTGAEADNFTIAHAGGAFTVSPLTVYVAVSGTQTYGSAPSFTPNYGSTGFVNSDDETVVSGTLSCLPSSTTLSAGSHAITSCSGLSASNYTIAYDLGSLVVSKKSITANVSGTQVYGGAPAWSVTYPSGSFVSLDTDSVVTGPVSCEPVDATLTVNVTGYDITSCSGLSADNYSIGYGLGKLVVTPKTITVNVTGTRVYGGPASFTPDFTDTQFANHENPGVVSGDLLCTTTGSSSSPVGSSYTISACGGLVASNYTIQYTYGSFSVTQRPVNVAVTGTQVYGATSGSYTPDYSNTDFVNGDTSSVVTNNLSCTSDAVASSPVAGTYHVVSCTGLTATNYAITIVPGAYTVTRAPLTVTADSQSITYGDAIPAYTFGIATFVLGQNASALTTQPSCGSSASTSSPAGSYTISCSGAAAANYSFSYVNSTLTIAKKGATLAYSGNLFWSTGSATGTTANVTLQATLTPGAGGSPDLANGAPVTFRLYKSTNTAQTQVDATCVASTMTSQGVATCNLPTLGIDNWTVIASIGDNAYFTAPNSDPVVITVYAPATDKFATGGGWVTDPSGSAANRHGNFGFTVRYSKNGSPAGQAVYVYRGTDGYNYVIKSNSWTGGGITFPASNTVSFSAKANVTVIDRATGLAVTGLGGGNYTFRVDATDNGAPGSTDTYAITVYAPNGVLFHQAGTTGSQLGLGGGNVTVHSTATK